MITLLYGSNAYARRRQLKNIIQEFKKTHGNVSIERRDGESLEPSHLPDLFQGMSLFASDKLVIVRDAAQNKAVWEALEPYIGDNNDATHIVLVEREPDKRTKTFKALQKQAEIIECKELSAGELITWLLHQSGGRLDRRLAAVLVQRVGVSQEQLSNELDKLLLHESITERHIEALVEPSPEGTAFELLDLVFSGRHERVSEIIGQLKLSEDPYRLLALLISNVHVLAALVADTNKTPQQVASDLGVHPFVASKLAQKRRRTSLAEVRATAKILADTDTALKTTGHDPWVVMQNTLIKIAAL